VQATQSFTTPISSSFQRQKRPTGQASPLLREDKGAENRPPLIERLRQEEQREFKSK
jgi:hypothetical protein